MKGEREDEGESLIVIRALGNLEITRQKNEVKLNTGNGN